MEQPSDTARVNDILRFERPDGSLDPYLDAFATTVLRFGVERTRAQDVAKQAGIDRTTLFRRVGKMDDLLRLYISREVHRFIDQSLTDMPLELDGPDLFIEVIARAIERVWAHPVLDKVVADEPDLVAKLVSDQLAPVVDQVAAAVANGLSMLVGVGSVAPVDAENTGQWIARFGLTTILARPAGDLRQLLDSLLRPALIQPDGA